MPAPRPPARLPNARRRRPDTRRSQFTHTPENQIANVVAVRLVAPDSLEVQLDRPVACYDTTSPVLIVEAALANSNEWTQTSPLTWQVQMDNDCAQGQTWTMHPDEVVSFSPQLNPAATGVILPN